MVVRLIFPVKKGKRMPNLDGRFSEAEKSEIRRKIDELWRGSPKNCPICGSNKWFLADHVVEAPIVTQGVRGFGSAYPSVQLISETCGYTVSFNAVILGVMRTAGFP
jgi:hypothetical protein